MIVTAKVNKEKFIKAYVALWSGMFQFTEKEQYLLYLLLNKYLEIRDAGTAEPYASQLLFSSAIMKEIRQHMDLSHQSFNNYKTALVKKKALVKVGDGYTIPAKLIPTKELTFKFIVE